MCIFEDAVDYIQDVKKIRDRREKRKLIEREILKSTGSAHLMLFGLQRKDQICGIMMI